MRDSEVQRFRGMEGSGESNTRLDLEISRSVVVKKNAGQNEVIIDSRIFIITSVKLSDETSDKCLTFIHRT